MGEKVTLEVKTISSEIIKPFSPTPPHLKTLNFSLLDQIHPPYHTIMLLFYPETQEITAPLNIITVLKTSLSKTLSTFYPFAGRCNDDFTVSCNDEGIPFIETRVDFGLSDFLTSPNKIEELRKLTPPREFRDEKTLSKLVPLAFQVNVFSCGGVVIGCYKLHKLLLDGTSLATFLKHWAANARSESSPVNSSLCTANYPKYGNSTMVAPDFDAVVTAFPPRPTMGWRPFEDHEAMAKKYEDVHVVAKSFVFTKHAISELRVKAASEEVRKPTRVEALAGFVWEHCMAAAYAAGEMPMGPEPSTMALSVNMRPRLNPPLPSTSMGNLVTSASARAKEGMRLPELVRDIHFGVSKVGERIESYCQGSSAEGVDKLVGDVEAVTAFSPGLYGLSSWCQFGLEQVDFGFGKPKWASPTNGILGPLSRNFMYFVSDANGDGIEVWLYLEVKEMIILESNKEFLAFASPN